MIKNHLKTTWRNLLRNKQFTFLNLIGLSTGLASAVLIFLWVSDEMQVDKFNEKDSQLYKVLANMYRLIKSKPAMERHILWLPL